MAFLSHFKMLNFQHTIFIFVALSAQLNPLSSRQNRLRLIPTLILLNVCGRSKANKVRSESHIKLLASGAGKDFCQILIKAQTVVMFSHD